MGRAFYLAAVAIVVAAAAIVRLPLVAIAPGPAEPVPPRVSLEPRPRVNPPGVRAEDYRQAQLLLFQESAEVAAAFGLQRAGYPAKVAGGGARVVGVIKRSPADGQLPEGDVITAIDARPVRTASDVQAAAGRVWDGQIVTVTGLRGNEPVTLTLRLGKVSELGRPGLGVALESVEPQIALPSRSGSISTASAGPRPAC